MEVWTFWILSFIHCFLLNRASVWQSSLAIHCRSNFETHYWNEGTNELTSHRVDTLYNEIFKCPVQNDCLSSSTDMFSLLSCCIYCDLLYTLQCISGVSLTTLFHMHINVQRCCVHHLHKLTCSPLILHFHQKHLYHVAKSTIVLNPWCCYRMSCCQTTCYAIEC